MLSAGRLNTRIVIEAPAITRGPSNEKVDGWAIVVDETWAEIKPMSVSRVLLAQSIQSKATVMITMRYRDDINRTMRIRRLRDGAIFAIEAEPQPDDRSGLEWLTLTCSRGINDGQ